MLAAWSSWGAIPQIFDESRDDWAAERAELRSLLSDTEWAAASRTTINAHYTDPAIVSAMWTAVGRLGLAEGQVLEPGAGSGTFIGLAPEGLRMTGVELDPTTARIAQALYPAAEIRSESFADTRYPTGSFDAAIGNVPFGNVTLYDKLHNANGHSLHNHFILKSLDFVRPGGVVAVLTSSFTMDSTNP
ncbi:MAG: methyltransferase domain-containing protein, partial [Nakamurella sp.]